MSISTISVVEAQQDDGKFDGLHFSEQFSPSLSPEKKPIQAAVSSLNPAPPPKHSFSQEVLTHLSRIEGFSKTPGYDDYIHAAVRSLRLLSTDWVNDAVTQGLVPDGTPYRYNKVTSLFTFFGDIIRSQGGDVAKLADLEDRLNCLFPDLLDEIYSKLDEEILNMFVG